MKKEKTTLQQYKKYKRIDKSLKAGVIATPTMPLIIMTAVNWESWFGKAGISLPIGFTALLGATVGAIIAILRSDTIFKKKELVLLSLGLIFCVLGLVDMWLASLIHQLGVIMLSIGGSCVGSFVEFKVDEKLVQPRVAEYKELVETYALDPKSAAKKARKEKAKQEAEEKAKKEAEEKEKYGGLI